MKASLVVVLAAAVAGSAFAADKDFDFLKAPPEVLSVGSQVPIIDRPIPVPADALNAGANPVVPNGPLLHSGLQATTTQLGSVAGNSISNLGQAIPSALAPAGPALQMGNVIGAPRVR